MTTIEKIKAEIRKMLDRERDFTSENAKVQALALFWVLEIIDKYAEQEPKCPCDLCMYDSMDGDYKHCGYYGECPAMAKGGE